MIILLVSVVLLTLAYIYYKIDDEECCEYKRKPTTKNKETNKTEYKLRSVKTKIDIDPERIYKKTRKKVKFNDQYLQKIKEKRPKNGTKKRKKDK